MISDIIRIYVIQIDRIVKIEEKIVNIWKKSR